MELRVKDMDISTGGPLVVILNKKDALALDLHPLDRLKVYAHRKFETVLVDIGHSAKAVPAGSLGVFEEVLRSLGIRSGNKVKVVPARKPLSLEFIKKKLDGKSLSKKEINQIVWDIVHNKLNDVELTYFVASCYMGSMTEDETVWLTKAMASHGDTLKLNQRIVMDKHCVGGVPGNRTTMVVVPLVAAAGLVMPKTSSRSITSPAGTADTMEVLASVSFSLAHMKKIVEKVKACMVWGGALNLAPADDKIIKVEKPLTIDAKSQLLASVIAKKASVSATHVLIDIPFGLGTKTETRKEAMALKKDFERIMHKLGMKTEVVLTDGSQPIGNGIGPALEARDVLFVLKNDPRAPQDLRSKSLLMAGLLLELGGKAKKGKGRQMALSLLESGKGYKKMIEIIKLQGGKEIDPEHIKVGQFSYDYVASKTGTIKQIDNFSISKIARIAGAPQNKGAGMYFHFHKGAKVKKGEVLFTIYAENKRKLDYAKDILKELGGVVVG